MPPNDPILIRATAPVPAVEDDGRTLFGRVASANEWAEIDSVTEGHFLERHAPGAFRKTFAENRDKIRVLFQHGRDAEMGTRPIAELPELGEDDVGPYYRAALLDGVPEMIRSGLRAGVYGSSHSFSVVREDWDKSPKGGPHNPKRLPERTIREVKVYELGPVTWPAYAGSTASVRSMTDDFLPTPPVAPSADAEPEAAHLEPERRDEPVPTIAAAPPKETVPVDITQFHSLEDMAARLTELNAEIKRAAELPGILPDVEQRAFDEKVSERGEIERAMTAWQNRIDQVRAGSTDAKKAEPAYEAPTIVRKVEDIYDFDAIRRTSRSMDDVETKIRENALRSLETSSRSINVDGLADVIQHRDEGEEGKGETARRVMLTGSPVYRRAFNKYLRGEKDLWSPEESRAAALAVTGTTTTGGYAVPYVFDPTMIHIGAFTAVNPFRAACRVETITNGNNWRAVTVGAITAGYGTEASAASEGGPTFGQPSYTVQTAKAFATVSIETMEDRPDITSELTSVFAEAKDTLEENQFAVGAGTTVYPLGMFTDTAYTNKDTATNDVTAIADIRALEADLPLRFRAKAAFFMNRSTIRQLEALDTTGYYFKRAGQQFIAESTVLSQSLVGNTGAQLLGYPVWEVPSAVSTLTTDGAIIVVLADPKSYVIVDRLGMNVEVIPQMLNGATPSFPTLQRGIVCYWRNTAKPINADAGRSMSVQ